MKGKVLIVDDDRDLRAILSALFEDEFQVSEADTGAALQKALGSEQPDVVVLDVKLPDADGLDLIPQLLAENPNVVIIVVTVRIGVVRRHCEARVRVACKIPLRVICLRKRLSSCSCDSLGRNTTEVTGIHPFSWRYERASDPH
jgi:CheY-like chemotaxis protein